jgi:hypothetical protein
MHIIRKNTEALVIASKEIGLEVNAENTSRDQNAGQNGNIPVQNVNNNLQRMHFSYIYYSRIFITVKR